MDVEIDINHLPPIARELIDALGLTATLSLVEAFGGVRIYIPQHLTDDHVLVTSIGRALADVLSSRFGGEQLNIPRCVHALRAVRNTKIRRERLSGASPARLALRYAITERQIYTICSTVQPCGLQGSLF